ncbi:MAG: hypothetical protein P8X62_09490 [Flavobacteriaceae bacterium]
MKNLAPTSYLLVLTCLLIFGCNERETRVNSIKEKGLSQNSTIRKYTNVDLDSVLSPVTGFRTVHHMNLKNIKDEAEFVLIAEVFNKLVVELGYHNIRYNFWKFTGDRQGKYGYIFESNWPDRETFDEVHKYEEFKVTLDKWYPKFKSMISEEIYNRYVILN